MQGQGVEGLQPPGRCGLRGLLDHPALEVHVAPPAVLVRQDPDVVLLAPVHKTHPPASPAEPAGQRREVAKSEGKRSAQVHLGDQAVKLKAGRDVHVGHGGVVLGEWHVPAPAGFVVLAGSCRRNGLHLVLPVLSIQDIEGPVLDLLREQEDGDEEVEEPHYGGVPRRKERIRVFPGRGKNRGVRVKYIFWGGFFWGIC